MSKKYLSVIAVISAFAISIGVANAYPQNQLFGTGYGFAGYNNFSNGAAAADAVNKPQKLFVETSSSGETSDNTNYNSERNVSNITTRDHDEAPNAGYKTTYTYIEKDQSDYNPYTGADPGVNETKSIYTDGLGRLHFFGKGSLFRHKN